SSSLFALACSISYAVVGASRLLDCVYGGVGALVFSIFLVYDTQQVVGGRKYELSPEEYVSRSDAAVLGSRLANKNFNFVGVSGGGGNAARTQTTHRQVGAGPQPPPEPLCQHSLGQCTNLRYPGHTCAPGTWLPRAPYTQSDQASLNQTPLQFCQYQTNSNALQSIRCGEVVERPKRFCHQHEPDPLPEPINRQKNIALPSAFQVSKFVRAKVSEPNPHRVPRSNVRMRQRHRLVTVRRSVRLGRIDIPQHCGSVHPHRGVRAARCKLQALKTAYEDEVLRLQRELRQGYEKFVSSGGASAVGGSSSSSSTPGGVASSIASSSLRRSATSIRADAICIGERSTMNCLNDLLQSALDSANKVAKPQVFLQSPCTTPSSIRSHTINCKSSLIISSNINTNQLHRSASAQAQSHQSNLPPLRRNLHRQSRHLQQQQQPLPTSIWTTSPYCPA
uniref:Pecanex-like protein n=1 Tax=Macrostomum lignano TaxID=282301 RepID=A0A1I8FLF1_9PLAT